MALFLQKKLALLDIKESKTLTGMQGNSTGRLPTHSGKKSENFGQISLQNRKI